MDLNQLRAILDLVREHELAEFEIEHEGLRLKVRKDGASAPVLPVLPVLAVPGASMVPAAAVPAAAGLAPSVVAPPGTIGPAGTAGPAHAGAPGTTSAPPATGAGPAAAGAAPAAEAVSVEAELELAVVKSPIVGTFYRSPEPGAAPFVEIGATVKKGHVLCIIEAMKLMNEIDSEYDGEVMNIYVENGQPVQYGERLFAIRVR
jgi:acetyl-CoA carboxylase biotin carboxyl carrier protein